MVGCICSVHGTRIRPPPLNSNHFNEKYHLSSPSRRLRMSITSSPFQPHTMTTPNSQCSPRGACVGASQCRCACFTFWILLPFSCTLWLWSHVWNSRRFFKFFKNQTVGGKGGSHRLSMLLFQLPITIVTFEWKILELPSKKFVFYLELVIRAMVPCLESISKRIKIKNSISCAL